MGDSTEAEVQPKDGAVEQVNCGPSTSAVVRVGLYSIGGLILAFIGAGMAWNAWSYQFLQTETSIRWTSLGSLALILGITVAPAALTAYVVRTRAQGCSKFITVPSTFLLAALMAGFFLALATRSDIMVTTVEQTTFAQVAHMAAWRHLLWTLLWLNGITLLALIGPKIVPPQIEPAAVSAVFLLYCSYFGSGVVPLLREEYGGPPLLPATLTLQNPDESKTGVIAGSNADYLILLDAPSTKEALALFEKAKLYGDIGPKLSYIPKRRVSAISPMRIGEIFK